MADNTRVFLKYVDTLQSICKVKGYKNAKDWVNNGKDCKLNMSEKVHLFELIENRNTIAHQGININVLKDDIDFLYKIIESTGFDMKLLKVYSADNNEKKQPKKQDETFHFILDDRILDIYLPDVRSVNAKTVNVNYTSAAWNDEYRVDVIINTVTGRAIRLPLEKLYKDRNEAQHEAEKYKKIILNALKKYTFGK